MLTLTVSERLALKARAHTLNPTVIIGNAGLSESVLNEINNTLKVHELIKVKVMAERPAREDMLQQICEQLDAAAVQHIGKTLVLFRPSPDAKQTSTGKVKPKEKRLNKKQIMNR